MTNVDSSFLSSLVTGHWSCPHVPLETLPPSPRGACLPRSGLGLAAAFAAELCAAGECARGAGVRGRRARSQGGVAESCLRLRRAVHAGAADADRSRILPKLR